MDKLSANFWRKPGDENNPETTPAFKQSANANIQNLWKAADKHIQKADYIKLNEIILAYQLPAKWIKNTFIKEMNMTFQVQNVWKWVANDQGLDPEAWTGITLSPSRGEKEPVNYTFGSMMMNTIKLMMFLLLVGISVSCDRFLDIKPKGIQIPEYYDDYLRLLNHKDMMYADAGFVSYITDDILLGDNSVPFGQFEQAQEASQNLYAFAHGPIFSGGASDAFYEKAYKRIYTFNVVINNVGTCQDATEKEKQALIAEAKVCRAFEYLSLVNVYAKHYDSVTANSDLGVPVILSEDINKVYKRNSVQAVYDQIFKDLKEALPYIPDEAATPFRASKQFLYAFTAKLYLYMGKYGDALTAALKVDQDQLQLIDLTAYSINPKANGMGRIWNEETGEVYPLPEDNPEAIYARYGTDFLSLSRNVYASEDLKALYRRDLPAGAVDQRRVLNYADDTFKLYNNTYQFPGKSMWVAYTQPNLGMNSTEFFLILAECYARSDEMEQCLTILDRIRDKRIVGNVPLPRTTVQEALRLTLDERRREFALQGGSLRLVDLKRLNREEPFKKDILHTVGEYRYSLPANDERYVLPLPPAVISANPSIPVYPR